MIVGMMNRILPVEVVLDHGDHCVLNVLLLGTQLGRHLLACRCHRDCLFHFDSDLVMIRLNMTGRTMMTEIMMIMMLTRYDGHYYDYGQQS